MPRTSAMMDDYQYKDLNLPIKNKGLFGLGGSPSKNGIGYSGKIIDSSIGLNQVGGRIGEDGSQGATGATGVQASLPSASVNGDMAYYDGSKWVKLGAPAGVGLLVIKDYIPGWLHFNKSGILMYDEYLKSWNFISDPSTSPGIRVFCLQYGVPKWISAKGCSYG